jgi:hypothetical protein
MSWDGLENLATEKDGFQLNKVSDKVQILV